MIVLNERGFWENVEMGLSVECWNWKGKTIKNGSANRRFSRVWFNDKNMHPRKIAYELHYGKSSYGVSIIGAKCGNSLCVNPAHFVLEYLNLPEEEELRSEIAKLKPNQIYPL